MKKPARTPKLALRTETVRALDQAELTYAAGAIPTTLTQPFTRCGPTFACPA